MFSAMSFDDTGFRLLDQRLLPHEKVWLDCESLESVAVAIEDMVVRGAPAIACSAAFGLAVDAKSHAGTWDDYRPTFFAGIERLRQTRPTAVNLFYALDKMLELANSFDKNIPLSEVSSQVSQLAKNLYDDDLSTCMAIGRFGREVASGTKKLRVLTHCNTGSLATAGYGTALGVIRSLHENDLIEVVYADETRPYLQGSRLTAFELQEEDIPYKIVADSAAAFLMQRGDVDLVVVGADRVARNGDTANKVGTYSLAVHCQHHNIPFYIAAPYTTFDGQIASGKEIPVEQRSPQEILMVKDQLIAPKDAPVYNPSFDITPNALITGFITDKGLLKPPFEKSFTPLFQ